MGVGMLEKGSNDGSTLQSLRACVHACDGWQRRGLLSGVLHETKVSLWKGDQPHQLWTRTPTSSRRYRGTFILHHLALKLHLLSQEAAVGTEERTTVPHKRVTEQ